MESGFQGEEATVEDNRCTARPESKRRENSTVLSCDRPEMVAEGEPNRRPVPRPRRIGHR